MAFGKAYKLKQSNVFGQQIEAPVEFNGESFLPGDYLLQDNGVITMAHRAEFEEKYELLNKPKNKPQPKFDEQGNPIPPKKKGPMSNAEKAALAAKEAEAGATQATQATQAATEAQPS